MVEPRGLKTFNAEVVKTKQINKAGPFVETNRGGGPLPKTKREP